MNFTTFRSRTLIAGAAVTALSMGGFVLFQTGASADTDSTTPSTAELYQDLAAISLENTVTYTAAAVNTGTDSVLSVKNADTGALLCPAFRVGDGNSNGQERVCAVTFAATGTYHVQSELSTTRDGTTVVADSTVLSTLVVPAGQTPPTPEPTTPGTPTRLDTIVYSAPEATKPSTTFGAPIVVGYIFPGYATLPGGTATFEITSGNATFADGTTVATTTPDADGKNTSPLIVAGPTPGDVVVEVNSGSVQSSTVHLTILGAATPTPVPTATPTVVPTATPTVAPTATPTVAPTATPTPTAAPTVKPTAAPTATPTPTAAPTVKPTAAPTATPTPTVKPTAAPTATPTVAPTATPTVKPTVAPTATPTATPSPTATPTVKPTAAPTATPTVTPTATPSAGAASADLGISVAAPTTVKGPFAATLTVTNKGPSTATGVLVVAQTGFGLSVLGADNNAATLFGFTFWAIPSIAPGQSVTLHLGVKANLLHFWSSTINALVDSDTADPNQANNDAQAVVKF